MGSLRQLAPSYVRYIWIFRNAAWSYIFTNATCRSKRTSAAHLGCSLIPATPGGKSPNLDPSRNMTGESFSSFLAIYASIFVDARTAPHLGTTIGWRRPAGDRLLAYGMRMRFQNASSATILGARSRIVSSGVKTWFAEHNASSSVVKDGNNPHALILRAPVAVVALFTLSVKSDQLKHQIQPKSPQRPSFFSLS